MSSPTNFKGDFLTASDAGFSEALDRWAANARREAKIVAFVKDNADVLLALKYAKENGLPIAVKGGGHSFSGASSIDGGLVVDLSRYLDGCRIDVENKLAYVQGGAIWGTVEKAAIKHELATLSGTDLTTGVGGLALGGGYGALSGERGMAVDCIVQATVVTSTGLVLTANDKENEDLFFGIRGGGSNFGVCTEIVFRLFPQRPTIYAGPLIFPGPFLEKIMAVHEERTKAGEISPKELVQQICVVTPDGQPAVGVSLFYNGSGAEGIAHFKKYLDLGPMVNGATEIPYEVFGTLLSAHFKPGRSAYSRSTSLATLNYSATATAHEMLVKFAAETNIHPVLEYPLIHQSKTLEVPRDAMAFPRDKVIPAVLVFLWYEDTAGNNTELAREMSKKIFALLQEGQATSESARLGYFNTDGDATLKDDAKIAAAFGSNYAKLQAIKKKYDPELVLNRWFPIAPA
ncbi:hypothetical protein C8J56DRAFT_849809 [Mycena floridula]|nr:hypothetical protein C8J56DRAFT_849809 [Mycena floridula]